MQTADNIFDDMLTRLMFGKGHTYAYNSGGDPRDITDLSYEEIINFYKTHYHPSNSKFVSYGNFDFRNHIKYL
jgi:Zn-dependent M16 (insulinase) family peptidase